MQDCVQPSRAFLVSVLTFVSLTSSLLVLLLVFTVMEAKRQLNRTREEGKSHNKITEVEREDYEEIHKAEIDILVSEVKEDLTSLYEVMPEEYIDRYLQSNSSEQFTRLCLLSFNKASYAENFKRCRLA